METFVSSSSDIVESPLLNEHRVEYTECDLKIHHAINVAPKMSERVRVKLGALLVCARFFVTTNVFQSN